MSTRVESYSQPKTIREALSVLAEHGKESRFFFDSTQILAKRSKGNLTLLDLSHLNLEYIKSSSDYIEIGLLTTLRQLETSPLMIKDYFKILPQACGYKIRTLRNLVTLGSELMMAPPTSDVLLSLLCLDAELDVSNLNWKRSVSLENYLKNMDETSSNELGIPEAMRLPYNRKPSGVSIQRVVNFLKYETPTANVAVRVFLNDGEFSDARLCLGSVASRVIRVGKAEDALLGLKPTEANFDKVSKVAIEEISPTNDFRASSTYRKNVTKILVKRALVNAYEDFRGRIE